MSACALAAALADAMGFFGGGPLRRAKTGGLLVLLELLAILLEDAPSVLARFVGMMLLSLIARS
jgi:hypothetical protein